MLQEDDQVGYVLDAAVTLRSGRAGAVGALPSTAVRSREEVSAGRRLRNLVEITRPFALTASIVPVCAAGALALLDGLMSWGLFALALVAAVLLQVGTNVINEVYDVRKGIDSITSPRASQALVTGRVTEKDAFRLAYSAFAACAVLGLVLVAVRGWPLLLIGAFGLVMGWGYTAPPLQYKYRALGLPLVFLLMGPLMVVGGYYAVTGQWSWQAAVASVPIGLLVTAILHGNEWRDIGEDARAGIRTISISAGRSVAHWIYVVLLVGAYVTLALGVAFGLLPRLSLLAVLSMPLLVQALRASELGATGQQREIAMIDRNTARLHAAFGALFVLGFGGGVGRLKRSPSRPSPRRWRTRTCPSGRRGVTALSLVAAGPSRRCSAAEERFWPRMTRTGLGLGALALATEGDLRRWSRARATSRSASASPPACTGCSRSATGPPGSSCPTAPRTSATSTCCARCGPRARSPPGWPRSSGRPRSCTGAASCRPSWPAGSGRSRGAAAAAVIYGGAHVATGNATLVGAATVAGGVWSALAALGVPMPALVVSHVVWDIWIFLVQPTQPVTGQPTA